MADQKPSLDSVFCTAIEMESAEQRQEYVARVCGQDAELLRQVDRLLRAHDSAGSFLESPPEGVAPSTVEKSITEKPGTQIGPYKLLQQIGEGGMGVVYLAEQKEPVKRQVALKITKPGMDTKQVVARFEAERQALALMDHPNIAGVLDAGATESGRPYFVMELVRGVPITEYCDQNHLTTRDRLQLFASILQAVQHAHQKGIIHRDLKPSNVMVAEYDDRAIPKIIDFGVAKATGQTLTEKTLFTQYGQLVGTLEYMSPEQAKLNQLDIDTRSDIYSLGVLLYELLTGNMPFEKEVLRSTAFDEMLRIIREEEPPRPSRRLSTNDTLPAVAANRQIQAEKLTRLIRGELDWIVMKALEKDRTRRYETASAFAADINRYLADEPVQAAAPSVTYKLGKFARRHKAAFGAAAAMVALLMAGIAATAWQALRATREMNRAMAAEALAERRLGEAEEFSNFLKDVLEAQMVGYWEPDREKPLKLSRKFKKETASPTARLAEEISDALAEYVLPEILPRFLLEIQKGQVIRHGPGLKETGVFALESLDRASNTLTFVIPGEDQEVTIERDQLTFEKDGNVMIFKRISREEFEKRLEANKAGARPGEVAPAEETLVDKLKATPSPEKTKIP